MRLAKSIEIVLSIAACGSVVMVLSGSAYADDKGADTTTQTTPQVDSMTIETPVLPPASKQEDFSSTQKVGDEPAMVVKQTETATVPATISNGNNTPTEIAKAPEATTVVPVLKADSKNDAPVAAKLPATDTTSPLPATVTINMPIAETSPAPAAVTANSDESTEVRPTVLPIQPRITPIHPINTQDLAASLPSAPDVSNQPTNVPEPLQPIGLFSRLSATLAGSTVPNWPAVPTPDLLGGVIVVSLVLLGSLFLLGSISSFGSWLRRGGYAHAARSDVADLFNSIFATPFRMGYVPAQAPTHSSFLVVSEMKTAMTLFPTLTERRNLAC